MAQFINITFYPLVYFLFQLFFLRFFNININKVSTILLIFLISLFIALKTGSYETTLNLIALNLFIVCFYIFIPGILSTGPALLILDLLEKKRVYKKNKLKVLFNKNMKSLGIKKRLEINVKSKLVKKQNNKLRLTQKGRTLIYIFNIILKIFKLRSDR